MRLTQTTAMKNLSLLPNHYLPSERLYRWMLPPSYRSDFLFRMDAAVGIATAINPPDEYWEHVLLLPLTEDRCPTWPEMVRLKDMFWNPKEVVIQVHPSVENYINIDPYTLHLWKHRFFQYDLSNILLTTAELLKDSSTSFHSFSSIVHGRRFIAIYGGTRWPTWEEVCIEKQRYFGANTTAIQFNISREFDLNDHFLLTIWDATNYPLPPTRLV